MIQKPHKLNKGDTIGIVATSSHIVPERLNAGVKILESLGFKTHIHPLSYERVEQSAGTAEQKVKAFHDFINDPNIHAIFSARGGNRCATMLPLLDFELIKKNPKIFMGFSDTSILSMALESQSNLVSFFGHVVQTLMRAEENDIPFIVDILSGAKMSWPMEKAEIIKSGHAKGRLIGGTLSVIQSAIGSKYAPDFSNRILVLEDIGEELSHIDRKLSHLKLMGILDKVAGVVFGNFSNIKDTGEPFGFTLDALIREHTKDVNGPVIMNAPFGHEGPFYALPLGCEVELSVESKIHMAMTESAVM